MIGCDAEEARFIELMNAYRAEHGIEPVAHDTLMQATATLKTKDTALTNIPVTRSLHIDSEWLGAYRLGRAVGTKGIQEIAMATARRDTAEEALEAWQNSPGHNRAMLDPRWVGAGAARQRAETYWIWYCHFRQED